MESFIYHDLNRACREKQMDQIQYFGAFSAALSYIIYFANSNKRKGRDKMEGNTTLYLGIAIT